MKKLIILIVFLLSISYVSAIQNTSLIDINITFDDLTFDREFQAMIYTHYDMREINESFFNYSNIPPMDYEGYTFYITRGKTPSGAVHENKIDSYWDSYGKQLKLYSDGNHIHLIVMFDNPITVNSGTTFQLSSNSSGFDTYLTIVTKKERDDDCALWFQPKDVSENVANYLCDNGAGTHTEDQFIESSSSHNVGDTVTVRTEIMNISTATDHTDIKYIIFGFQPSFALPFYIDNLFIGNINVTFNETVNNSLPYVNISLDKLSECIAEGNSSFFNLTIDVFDEEDDIIYYSFGDVSQLATNYSVDYQTRNWLGWRIIEWTFSTFDVTPIGYCEVIDTSTYNNSKHNIELNYNPFTGDTEYMFQYNGFCDKNNKGFYQKLLTNFNDIHFYNTLFDLQDGEGFNLTFWDNSLTREIIDIRIYRENNTKYLWVMNESNYPKIRNISSFSFDDEDFQLGLDITRNAGFFNLTITHKEELLGSGVELALVNDNFMLDTHDIYAYSITPDINTTLYQKEYKYNGYFVNINFTTQSRDGWELSAPGVHRLEVYVSDVQHYPDEYIYQSFDVEVIDGEICYEATPFNTQTELLSEFENQQGKTGVLLYIDMFIWFLRFPYRLALSFGILGVLQGGVLLMLLLASFQIWNKLDHNLNAGIVSMFTISALLMLMKLMYVPLFALISIVFAIVVYKQIVPSSMGGDTD